MATLAQQTDWRQRTAEDLLSKIRNAGVVGMGGGGFCAATKLALARSKRVSRIIANGVECEPGISCDEQLLQEQLDTVVTGMAVVEHLVADSSGQATTVLAYAADFDAELIRNIEHRLPAPNAVAIERSPGSGAERHLSQLIFSQPIPLRGYAIDVGVLCFNVATLHAIAQAVVAEQPLTQRLVTVNGINRWLGLGSAISEALPLPNSAEHGGWYQVGGHYTGQATDATALVSATTNAIWPVTLEPPTPCTQCGLCADACPEALLPQTMLQPSPSPGSNTDAPEDQALWRCTDCGLCNTVCPSHIDLLSNFKQQKFDARTLAQQAADAQRAQQRFVRHQARTEHRTAATEARRQQRKQQRADGPRDW